MKPKIIAWNVRGLNAFKKRFRIRGLLLEWKADIVCLVETKMGVISREWFVAYGEGNMWDGCIRGLMGRRGVCC
jgi:exonuclease III